MVQFYESIPDSHAAWMKKQHMFFVATAPLKGEHINLSPKGLDGTFHIVSPNRVWYEDLSGSGAETIAHLRENGRITIMFCAVEGAARILRIYGRGSVHEFGTPEYAALVPPETRRPSSRAAIVVDVFKVSTSCGYAVPLYTFKAERSALTHWGAKMEKLDAALPPHFASSPSTDKSPSPDKEPEKDTLGPTVTLDTEAGARVYARGGMMAWWAVWNTRSHDGLAGLRVAHLSDAPLVAGKEVVGEDEPPSDGSVVILGNRVPKARAGGKAAERLKLAMAGRGLLPGSGAEAARLVCVFVLGLVLAAVYGQGLRRIVQHSPLGTFGGV